MEICLRDIDTYRKHLTDQEKAETTIQRYIRCIMNFYEYMRDGEGRAVTRECLLEFKRQYSERYSISSTNLEIIALNSFFQFLGAEGMELATLKSQKKMFRSPEMELNQMEMERLYRAARQEGDCSLPYVLLCTLSGTGIRVSELGFLTVEAVKSGCVTIYLKGKARVMPLSPELIRVLAVLLLAGVNLAGASLAGVNLTGLNLTGRYVPDLSVNLGSADVWITISMVCLCIASIQVWCFQAAPQEQTAILLVFWLAILLLFVSGGFLPSVFLPEALERVSGYLPGKWLLQELSGLFLWEYSAKNHGILAGFTLLFVILSGLSASLPKIRRFTE